jgi:hypothetical protein
VRDSLSTWTATGSRQDVTFRLSVTGLAASVSG